MYGTISRLSDLLLGIYGTSEYNCSWYFGLVFITVLSFRLSSSSLSSYVSFFWYYFTSALDTRVHHRDSLDCHVDMNGILRYFCLDHVRYWLLHCNILYMYKVLLVYSFVFHLICHCCPLTLTVLCFSVCCLFRCLLCCCFLGGRSVIGTTVGNTY